MMMTMPAPTSGSPAGSDPAPNAPNDAFRSAVGDPVGQLAEGEGARRAGHDDGGEVSYTIDELAGLTGVPSRTIRFYQSKGTLPSPRRKGRVALYGPEHVERLKIIADLQDRGLRLDAIRDVLDQIERGGDSLHSWLGVGERLQVPWSDERPTILTRDELIGRFDGGRPGLVSDLERAGIIRRETDSLPASYLVPSPGLLDIGVRLDKAGIDVDTALGAAGTMRKYLSRLSDELVSYFADRAGKGFGREGAPEDVVAAYDALRPIGADALRIIFNQEIERSLREFVESGRAISPRGRRSSSKSGRPSRSGKPSGSSGPSKGRPRSKP